jgi:homocysteine S-methyltransferase
LIASSIDLACEGRDSLDKDKLVAGSIGPYGACLADGSEYTGAYKDTVSVQQLSEWHKKRFEIIVDWTNCDILAVETIPCISEVEAILSLLKTRPGSKAWISLSCNSGTTLNSGEKISDCVKKIEEIDTGTQVEAVGVNCSKFEFINELISEIRSAT